MEWVTKFNTAEMERKEGRKYEGERKSYFISFFFLFKSNVKICSFYVIKMGKLSFV